MPTRKSVPSAPRYERFRPRSSEASRVGAGNRRQDTTPELLLRAALRSAGVRFRSNVKTLPGCPDFILANDRVAVFCDGDFWHGRQWSRRKRKLLAGWNADYWVAKIERNRARDRSVTRTLRRLGWKVVRLWEGDVRRNPSQAAAKVVAAATALSAPPPSTDRTRG